MKLAEAVRTGKENMHLEYVFIIMSRWPFQGGRYALVNMLLCCWSFHKCCRVEDSLGFAVGQMVVAVPRPSLLSQCPCPDPRITSLPSTMINQSRVSESLCFVSPG